MIGIMKYLGVDPGEARIGLSISDEQGILARPLSIINHISRPENARRIAQIASLENCNAIVVGVPYDSDGGNGPRARASIRLMEELQQQTDLPILSWDESGTSKAADELFVQTSITQKKRRVRKDDVAAMLILQDFLENHKLEGKQTR